MGRVDPRGYGACLEMKEGHYRREDRLMKRVDARGFPCWLTIFLVVLLVAIFTLAGCRGGEKAVEGDGAFGQENWRELWDRSEEAGKEIVSFSLEIHVYYQGTEFGSGLVQSSKMKVNGEDYSVETSLFGQPVSEVIRVGGNMYTRTIADNQWKRERASQEAPPERSELGKLSSLPENASSVEYRGVEELEGQPTYRLCFKLDPEKVMEVLPSVPKGQIAENRGASIDVWIRYSDFQRVKYEMIVANTKITEQVGYGDLRVVINIRDINGPVVIKPPA